MEQELTMGEVLLEAAQREEGFARLCEGMSRCHRDLAVRYPDASSHQLHLSSEWVTLARVAREYANQLSDVAQWYVDFVPRVSPSSNPRRLEELLGGSGAAGVDPDNPV